MPRLQPVERVRKKLGFFIYMRENEEEGVMGDAGTLGNGMRCDRNRRDRQLSTARTAAVKVIPRFVTVPTAICAPIPKTA